MQNIVLGTALILMTAAANAAPPRDMGRGAPAPPTADGTEGVAVESTIPDHGTPSGMIDVIVPSLGVLGGWVSKDQATALKEMLPLTVELPINDAANACGVEAAALTMKGAGACIASSGSRVLSDGVIRQMKRKK